MLEFIGILMIAAACTLFVQYQPKTDANRMLCAMMAVMGLVSLLAGQGNLFFTGVQSILELAMGFCCTLRVRREYLFRIRRTRRLRALHRASVQSRQVKRAG